MTFWMQMHDIVERDVEYYKTDLMIDMRTIGTYGEGHYIWATRSTGTDIVPFPASDWPDVFVSSAWFTCALKSNDNFYMVLAYDDANLGNVEPMTIRQVIDCLKQMPTREGQGKNIYLAKVLRHQEFIRKHGKIAT